MLAIRLLSFFILLNWLSIPLLAQHDSIPCKVNKQYFKEIANDSKQLILKPLTWDEKQWIGATTIIATSAILFTQDQEIASFFHKNQSSALTKADDYFFDPFGKMYFTTPLMGILYIYGASSNRDKPKRIAMDFVQACLYSGVMVTALKHLAHRHRPYQTQNFNSNLWDGPLTDDLSHTSFPSGHTIMAFTFASVLSAHYKEKKWVSIVTYSLAGLEGLSRIYTSKHWSSDVVIGASLGYAIGTFVVNQNHCKLKTIPLISPNFSGLILSYPLH
jgi:membrane-associated phospholipid phosphatase